MSSPYQICSGQIVNVLLLEVSLNFRLQFPVVIYTFDLVLRINMAIHATQQAKRAFAEKFGTGTKMLSPYNIRYFVAVLRFVAIYTIFMEYFRQK